MKGMISVDGVFKFREVVVRGGCIERLRDFMRQTWDEENLTDEWIKEIITVIMSDEYDQRLLDVIGTMGLFEFSKLIHIVKKNLVIVEDYTKK